MALAPRVALGSAKRRLVFYSSTYLVWVLLVFFATRHTGNENLSWLAGWQQWDAHWYEQIWQQGYPAADPRTLVFPPAYAFLVGGLSRIFSLSFLATAVILNVIAFFCGAVLIAEWLSRKFGVSASASFVFVLSAPAAYFAFTAYSDVIFMLGLWVLLWIALALPGPRRREIVIAESALLFVLPWIRLTGYALASWLLARRRVALAVVASFALWLAFNRLIAGSPFYFLHAQELFAMPKGNFFQGFADSLLHLVSDPRRASIWLEFGFLPMFYLGALTGIAAWLARRGEGLLALTVLSILALSYNQAVWRSAVRYDLPLTPLLCLPLLMSEKSPSSIAIYFRRAGFYALTLAHFSLQIYFARLFHSGGWAF